MRQNNAKKGNTLSSPRSGVQKYAAAESTFSNVANNAIEDPGMPEINFYNDIGPLSRHLFQFVGTERQHYKTVVGSYLNGAWNKMSISHFLNEETYLMAIGAKIPLKKVITGF